ncbi:MAG: hypothetical protein OXC02_02540 [Rhodobacteraceae bacterium]|nr:hypothetical protein [Paracoccaceae bacterium]
MSNPIKFDISSFKSGLSTLPLDWDGKTCILELKEADYNWKQMEWWAFYFEYKVKKQLEHLENVSIPGERFDRVEFDLKTTINWDIKAKAIKTDDNIVILNDKEAMKKSMKRNGYHGEIIGLCDVEYNDIDRSFQKWHSELKGGLSPYELERKQRTSISRYRKTSATLMEIVYITFSPQNSKYLSVMNQGRNSNGKPRPPKYSLKLAEIDIFENEIQKFKI